MQVLNLIKNVYKKQRQYENLDLDYITPRIIVMSYPRKFNNGNIKA